MTFELAIDDLLVKLVSEHHTDAAAIRYMSATIQRSLDPSLISVWAKRLNIVDRVEAARESRPLH